MGATLKASTWFAPPDLFWMLCFCEGYAGQALAEEAHPRNRIVDNYPQSMRRLALSRPSRMMLCPSPLQNSTRHGLRCRIPDIQLPIPLLPTRIQEANLTRQCLIPQRQLPTEHVHRLLDQRHSIEQLDRESCVDGIVDQTRKALQVSQD